MKYLVVLVFLLGLACGSEDEETSLQELVELEDEDLDMSPRQTVTPVTLDPQLILGNIIQFLNSGGNGTTPIDAILGPLLALVPGGAGLAALLALKPIKLTGGLGLLSTIDSLLAGIPGLIMIPVGIANMILPIVGLVFLILYLVAGEPIEALFGVQRRSLNLMPSFSSFDLINNPIVESISEMFFQAMEKYDN